MVMPTGGSGFRYSAGHTTAGNPPEAERPFDGTRDLPDFREGEEQGATASPACSRHKDCSRCRSAIEQPSPREREAAARIDAGVKVVGGVAKVRYPSLPCVAELRDNSSQAEAGVTSSRVSEEELRAWRSSPSTRVTR